MGLMRKVNAAILIFTAFISVPAQMFLLHDAILSNAGFFGFLTSIVIGAVMMFSFSMDGHLLLIIDDNLPTAEQRGHFRTFLKLHIFSHVVSFIIDQLLNPSILTCFENSVWWAIPLFCLECVSSWQFVFGFSVIAPYL